MPSKPTKFPFTSEVPGPQRAVKHHLHFEIGEWTKEDVFVNISRTFFFMDPAGLSFHIHELKGAQRPDLLIGKMLHGGATREDHFQLISNQAQAAVCAAEFNDCSPTLKIELQDICLIEVQNQAVPGQEDTGTTMFIAYRFAFDSAIKKHALTDEQAFQVVEAFSHFSFLYSGRKWTVHKMRYSATQALFSEIELVREEDTMISAKKIWKSFTSDHKCNPLCGVVLANLNEHNRQHDNTNPLDSYSPNYHAPANERASDEPDAPSPDMMQSKHSRHKLTVNITDFLKGQHTNEELDELFLTHDKPRSAWERREDAHKVMTDPRTNVGGPARMERKIRQKWAANFMNIVHEEARKAVLAVEAVYGTALPKTPVSGVTKDVSLHTEASNPPEVDDNIPSPEPVAKPSPHRPPPLCLDVAEGTRELAAVPPIRSSERAVRRPRSTSPWLGATPERPVPPISRPWHPWHPREPEGHPYQALRYNQPAARLRLKPLPRHGREGGGASAMPPPRSGTPFDRPITPPVEDSLEQVSVSPQAPSHRGYAMHSRRLASPRRQSKRPESAQISLLH